MKIKKTQFLIDLMYYIKIWYLWGGKDPKIGLDCSGLIYSILTRNLKVGPFLVLNAQNYYEHFKNESGNTTVLPGCAQLGDIAFYGKDKDHIHHIAMFVDSTRIIEAARGDSTVINEFQARMKEAYVTISPFNRLSDLFTIIRSSSITAVLEQ